MNAPGRPRRRRAGDDRKASGDEGENRARAHLEAAGLTLVAKNWKAPPRPGFGGHGGELDLVMRDGEILVIVEVRTARAGFAGGASYTVGPAKRRRLSVLAQLFLMSSSWRPRAIRFDVVAFDRTQRQDQAEPVTTLRWFKNAFTV